MLGVTSRLHIGSALIAATTWPDHASIERSTTIGSSLKIPAPSMLSSSIRTRYVEVH